MVEFLENLTKSDVFIAAIAFITTNFATIFSLIVYLIKNKLKSGTAHEEFEKECQSYVTEAKNECEKTLAEVKQLMLDLKIAVDEKIKKNEEDKKAEREEQMLKLSESIALTKSAISIDDILEEKK